VAAGLFTNDPIIAQNFFLEIDGSVISSLTSVTGLDIEVAVSTTRQAGAGGVAEAIKAMGTRTLAPEITLVRVAPLDSPSDKMWKWFNDVRGTGLKATDRAGMRKNGSIVLYDTSFVEIGRFNFLKGWPSKIATDAVSTESSEAVKETITLVIERLDRVK
jgi:phage tail-like protein